MGKILILSSFPAPYRIEVFKGIAEKYNIDVFFSTDKDQDRSKEFFVKKNDFIYYVMTEENSKTYFKQCVANLKQYDLVLAYDWYLDYALKVQVKCILKNIPYIINCDGAFIEKSNTMGNKIKDMIKSFFICHARCCFSSGKYATKYFLHYGAQKDHIVEHPFSSLKRSEIREKPLSISDKILLRKELGLSDCKCVVSVGQFIYRKGFDVLLEAWKNLDNDYQLVIIGGGSLESDYNNIINRLQLKNVRIVSFIPKSEVLRYLEAADLFVLPTREDIWGLVVNEALAVGTPVVTTDHCIAGMELLEGNDCGKIVPINDKKALEVEMSNLLNIDEDLTRVYGRNSIKAVQSYYFENIIEHHIMAIDSILQCDTRLQ